VVRRRVVREAASAPDDLGGHVLYVESSALLAAFLESDAGVRRALQAARRRITSALTLAESRRTLVRARALNRLTTDDERAIVRGLTTFARACDIVAVTDEVLARAGKPFPVEPVRTLDAVHLATLEVLAEPAHLVTVLTRDERVAANARALGYGVA
jgi:predicted nucleic acid-binding protein